MIVVFRVFFFPPLQSCRLFHSYNTEDFRFLTSCIPLSDNIQVFKLASKTNTWSRYNSRSRASVIMNPRLLLASLDYLDFMTATIFVKWCRLQWTKTLGRQSCTGHLFFDWNMVPNLDPYLILIAFLSTIIFAIKTLFKSWFWFLFYRICLSIHNSYVLFHH